MKERCCYWEYYTSLFRVLENVVAGTATVTVSIPAVVLPFEFSRQTVEVPVLTGEAARLESAKSTQK